MRSTPLRFTLLGSAFSISIVFSNACVGVGISCVPLPALVSMDSNAASLVFRIALRATSKIDCISGPNLPLRFLTEVVFKTFPSFLTAFFFL